MGNKLYVGNLPYSVRDGDLEQAFSLLGGIPRGRGGAVRAFAPCGLECTDTVPKDAELLLVVMRDPLASGFVYRESVYGASDRPAEVLEFARDYRNPWLLRALVEFPFRARNPQVLADIARRVLAQPANEGAPDAAAALAVLGYQMLEREELVAEEVTVVVRRMVEHLDRVIPSPHAVRWSISLRCSLGSASAWASSASRATYTLPSTSYQAGIWWPHHSWREMHQSWMLFIHWL